jgi:hypothetical protein
LGDRREELDEFDDDDVGILRSLGYFFIRDIFAEEGESKNPPII